MNDSVLICLNYQREIPPFMLTELEIASAKFDKIYYISPELHNDNSFLVNSKNTTVIQISRNKWLLSWFKLPLMLFRKESLKNIINAINLKRADLPFFKKHITYLICSNVLNGAATKEIRKEITNKSDIIVMASWFSVEAYAASLIKKRFTKKQLDIYTVSLAHSFEVDPSKNNYIDLTFNIFKHKYLDNINFISKSVYNIYHDLVMKKYSLTDQNISLNYLGCQKLYPKMNRPSRDGVFRVLSCSGMTPVKRIYLIMEAIKKWDYCRIEWTHIGGGPLFNNIKNEIDKINENHHFASVNLLGTIDNSKVHKYYSENPCDIFVNVSSAEGLPVSLMECMAYGIPVIATNVGGNKEIVNKTNGFLLPAEITGNDLLFALLKYYRKNERKKKLMRENAYSQWSSKFNANKNISEYFDMLKNID